MATNLILCRSKAEYRLYTCEVRMIGRTWFPFFTGGNEHQNFEITLANVNDALARNSQRAINIETVNEVMPVIDRLKPIGLHVWWEKVEPAVGEQTQAPADQLRCTWRYQEPLFTWHSDCGSSWQFTDGNPKENGMRFCHSCGKPMMVVEDFSESDQ